MEIGPVEYVLATFVDGKFRGEIAGALADLVDRGLIRIIDLIFISKAADGSIIAQEIDALDPAEAGAYTTLDGEYGGLLTENDLAVAAERLEPGTAAGLLVWENVWATEFASALRNAGGEVIAYDRIPREDVEAAFAGLGTS
jgi:hypothetical protein